MNNVLVTGAAGFLGTSLVLRLTSLGVRVRALIRSSDQAHKLEQIGADVVVGDIRAGDLQDAVANVDTVMHCAAAIGPPTLSREERFSTNVMGTQNLVQACHLSRSLRRFVHISTVAVVGSTDPCHPADEQVECHPIDSYGETKLLAEKVILKACNNGLPAVILRPMWIYGTASPLTANLFRKIARRKLPMVGSAQNTMQPIAIQDVLDAVLATVAAPPSSLGQIYNIAGCEVFSIRSMCEIIAEAVESSLPRITIPLSLAATLAAIVESVIQPFGVTPPITRKQLEFFQINNSYSIELALKQLNWAPKIGFRDGAHQVAEELRTLCQL